MTTLVLSLPGEAPAPRSAEPAEIAAPPVPQVLLSMAALSCLGLCAVLPGELDRHAALSWVFSVPGVWLGAAVLSAPPMLVATELLQLTWRVTDVLHALLAGIVRSGRLAAAVVPVALLFVGTSSVGTSLSLLFVALVALPGLATVRARMQERLGASGTGTERIVLGLWLALLTAIGLRLLLQPAFLTL